MIRTYFVSGVMLLAGWCGSCAKPEKNLNAWQIIKNGLPDSTAFTTLEITETGLIAGIGLRK